MINLIGLIFNFIKKFHFLFVDWILLGLNLFNFPLEWVWLVCRVVIKMVFDFVEN